MAGRSRGVADNDEHVIDDDEHIVREEDEGVSAAELLAGVDDPGKEGGRGRGGSEEVEDDLSVEGGVEDGATVLKKLVVEGSVVDEVAIVGDGDGAEAVAGDEGLDVVEWEEEGPRPNKATSGRTWPAAAKFGHGRQLFLFFAARPGLAAASQVRLPWVRPGHPLTRSSLGKARSSRRCPDLATQQKRKKPVESLARASFFSSGSRLGFIGSVEESQLEVVTCPAAAWAGRMVASNLMARFWF